MQFSRLASLPLRLFALQSRCKHVTTHYSVRGRASDPRWAGVDMTRAREDVDLLIVGGGPAGMSAAIRAGQLNELRVQQGLEPLRVCLLEKSADFGGHMLSGACLEPTALNELFPDWQTRFADIPVRTKVVTDEMNFLLNQKIALPVAPPPWFPVTNHGNYLISLSQFVKWMSGQAEGLGVEMYNGVAASEVLYHPDGSVAGVATVDQGIHKDGSPKESFERGLELAAKCTLFAEGCHGSLTKQVINKFNLREKSCPQTYSIGLKELWQVDKSRHKPGRLVHNLGWPSDYKTYAGSFMYHYEDDSGAPLVSLGLVISLDYKNPYLNPFQEMQKLKTHSLFKNVLEGGERIGYGARALNEGGYQAIPKLVFPGGGLIGCTAGFLNIIKIKGIHTAMKSGMLAAESFFDTVKDNKNKSFDCYQTNMENSSVFKELYASRNVRSSFNTPYGVFGMMLYSGVVFPILRGKEPFTAKWHHKDCEELQPASKFQPITYPKPDNKLTFDLLSSVALTNTNHDHDSPSHLTLLDDDVPQKINLEIYDGPEQRYCPAGVYEFVEDQNKKTLFINAQNCIHCKTCDIKDPSQNINWVVPQGGEGPSYSNM